MRVRKVVISAAKAQRTLPLPGLVPNTHATSLIIEFSNLMSQNFAMDYSMFGLFLSYY